MTTLHVSVRVWVLLFVTLSTPTPMLAEKGILELDVRNEDGTKFPAEELHIEVSRLVGSSNVDTAWTDTRKKMQYGRYVIKVQAAGFYTQAQTVNHSNPVTKVRVGMVLGYMGHCTVPSGKFAGSEFDCLRSAVRIKVEPIPDEKRDIWVRLIPLQSGEATASRQLRSDGTLEFGGLRDTLYYLVVAEASDGSVEVLANRLIEPRFFYDEDWDVVRID